MKESTSKAMSRAKKFYNLNKQLIESTLPDTKIMNIECLFEDEIAQKLDTMASIDMLGEKNGLIFGIALRFNFQSQWHNHITIRYSRCSKAETEYSKTKRAIKCGAICAKLGLQVDVEEEKIVRIIVYDRYDLFTKLIEKENELIKTNIHKVYEYDKIRYNEMMFIDYNWLNSCKIKSKVYNIK